MSASGAIDGSVLEARGVSLGFGGQAVLQGVDLRVERGEFWFLLGPNGTGKTTLLRAILGVVRPEGGEVLLSPLLGGGRRIGFVPQRCNLKSTLPMTVAEFVRLGLTGTGIRGADAKRNVAIALEEVGLSLRAAADYWSLSGGQRQRALVARGLVRRPDLLILDEPTNGLDIPAEESFLALVARLNRDRGLTVLIVTHTLGLAARFASHVALVSRRTVLAGPRADVLSSANLREAYGVEVEVSYDAAGHPFVRVGGDS